MIRLLGRLVKWLEARFPEKLVVKAEEYQALRAELDLMRDDVTELKQHREATAARVAHLEASAVHKGAVQELVKHVDELKNELVSLKVNLGWSNRGVKADEISAILNGEPINHGE